MDHPPCSLDLAHSVFHIFVPFKKHLAGKQFTIDSDVKQAVTSWLQTLHPNFFCTNIQALVPMQDRSLNVNGDYVEM
jgi:hypothetical protein